MFSPLLRTLVLAGCLGAWAVGATAAEEPVVAYQYSPYKVRVWIGFSQRPELTSSLMRSLIKKIANRGDSLAHAAWRLEVEPAPASARGPISLDLEQLTYEQMLACDETLVAIDKLILLSVDADAQGFLLRARELDTRMQYFGPLATRRAADIRLVPEEGYRASAWAFSPVGKVEKAKGKSATLRIRAGGLILRPENPAAMDVGSVLAPVIRRNNRYGKPRKNGITAPPWTYIVGQEHIRTRLECLVMSGVRSPISGRSGRKTEKVGILVRPPSGTTQLRLVARKTPHGPLVGYDIYEKAAQDGKPLYVGRTDWRGVLDIGQGDTTMRVLYVKNGDRLLARLPLVPGERASVEAQVPNDDERLAVVGFVTGLQSSIVDLVAQREVLAVRIRKEIAKSQLDKAQKLMEKFRALPTPDDLSRKLEQQRSLRRQEATDKRSQERVDKLYGETRALLAKYLSGNMAATLSAELLKAKQAKSG